MLDDRRASRRCHSRWPAAPAGAAKWDADGVRDDLRDYVIDAFGDPGAILVVDETGDVKKGMHSVGVQCQYTGTAGRIENAQVAVYLTYAAQRGHALIDRAVYLPRSWAEDPERCTDAGIPTTGRCFATKPALATALIARAVVAKVPAAWVAGDEVYGADPPAPGGHPQPWPGLRAGRVGQPARAHPSWRNPGGSTPGPPPQTGVAETLRRYRQPRAALLRLGLDRAAGRRRRRHRPALFADPPQRHHRRAGLPTVPLTAASHPARPCQTYGATHRGQSPCTPLSKWPVNAGVSRNRSKPPKASPGWINTRSGAGPPGIGGPPWHHRGRERRRRDRRYRRRRIRVAPPISLRPNPYRSAARHRAARRAGRRHAGPAEPPVAARGNGSGPLSALSAERTHTLGTGLTTVQSRLRRGYLETSPR